MSPPPPPPLAPPFASQSDIVLVSQKDQFHINEFREDLFSLVERISPPSLLFGAGAGAKPEVYLLADFLYLLLTKGRQTLGEEYCDVFLYELDGRTRFRRQRLWLVACLAVGPYLLQRIELGGWQSLKRQRHRRPQQQQQQSQSRLAIPKRIQAWLLQLVSVAARVHLAVFYFRGDYLSPIHRAFGAKYLFTREPDQPRPGFSLLAYFIAFQLGVEGLQAVVRRVRGGGAKEELASIVPSALAEETGKPNPLFGNPCGICLEPITAPACPPCGHVYCYECIVESTIAKPECPLCRRAAEPRTVLCVY